MNPCELILLWCIANPLSLGLWLNDGHWKMDEGLGCDTASLYDAPFVLAALARLSGLKSTNFGYSDDFKRIEVPLLAQEWVFSLMSGTLAYAVQYQHLLEDTLQQWVQGTHCVSLAECLSRTTLAGDFGADPLDDDIAALLMLKSLAKATLRGRLERD